jgi:beta-mannanase
LTPRAFAASLTIIMSDLVQSWKMDRTAFSVKSLTEAAEEDRTYWRSKTLEERLTALELMRQIHYGYDPSTERLQRVLEIVELGEG